jgi:hypothetical protein
MQTSELEYYLIQELIGMPERDLAHKIELHIWFNCSIPQPKILAEYLQALEESSSPEDFSKRAQIIIDKSGLDFISDRKTLAKAINSDFFTSDKICISGKPSNLIKFTLEDFIASESQQPKF